MKMEPQAEPPKEGVGGKLDEEDDEHDSKEKVLQRYFLQEWQLVKSLLDDIVSNRRATDLSSVHKIRSIVLFPPLLSLSRHLLSHWSLSYPVLNSTRH